MASSNQDLLKLDQQVCFPLYAASRLMMQLYRPYLDEVGLTYPQYLVLMVLWEQDGLNVGEIGERLHLDSATLTQILGNLEKSEIIRRSREPGNARVVTNHLTTKGKTLRKKAIKVPVQMSCDLANHVDELVALRPMLQRLVEVLSEQLETRQEVKAPPKAPPRSRTASKT